MTPPVAAGSGAVNRSIGPANGPAGLLAVYATTCEPKMTLLSTVTSTYWLPTFCTPNAPPTPESGSRAASARAPDQVVPFQYCQAPPRPPAGTRARGAKRIASDWT